MSLVGVWVMVLVLEEVCGCWAVYLDVVGFGGGIAASLFVKVRAGERKRAYLVDERLVACREAVVNLAINLQLK